MARPKNADAAKTRTRILAAAAELFAEGGEGRTSVRDIAAAANVSIATIHHYFGSKDELYQAAIELMYDRLHKLRDELASALGVGGDIHDVVADVVRKSFRFALAHRSSIKLVMRAVIDTGVVPQERKDVFLFPMLTIGGELLLPHSRFSLAQIRLGLLSANHLLIRYVLTDPSEITELRDVIEADGDPMAMLEAHLVAATAALTGI